ncbi:MAG TPA: hypothetical protein VGN18_00435 [Jatrophihabitans sp.]|jgi:hypothetical protein|uniref:hypothetical protein n=1 Tax=Jatrophihabitans sp. TaxID=1932789 RepID=UPI002E0231C6|nr:hypothetical protein [Jatrophihabitans sp.]
MEPRNRAALQIALTVIVVVGLAIDAFVHYDLASAFRHIRSSTLGEDELFRAEATVAVVAAIALVIRPRRYTAAFAFLVAAGGTAAVVVYRYVDVGAFGPFPDMYDPFWAPTEKTVSVFAEAAAALAALGLFMMFHARTHRESEVRPTARVPVR